ncbi:MAG: carbohydrate ABC transporter permease [Clostridiales bacterium]
MSNFAKKNNESKILPIIFSRTSFNIFNYIFMTLTMLIMVLPLLKVFVDSLDVKGGYDFNLIPDSISFDAYLRIVKIKNLSRAFGVSVYTTVIGTSLALLFTTMAAFVLTKKDMPGRKFFMYMILFTMIFNGGLIPTYMVVNKIHLTDSTWAVILTLLVNPYYLILLRNFFNDISPSISESAEIDGCSPMGIFFKIILPMSKPAIAAIGLFYFVLYWNDFFHFIMYINESKLHNFQVKLRELVLTDDTGPTSDIIVGANTLKSAVIVVSILPIMIIYPFIQKYFVTGLSLGAIKE